MATMTPDDNDHFVMDGEGEGMIRMEPMTKIRVCLYSLIIFFVLFPVAHAQEFGKIRALQQRSAHVIKQKNDFIAKVLTSYAVPYERNAQDVVVRIIMDGRWQDVTSIEIVPILTEGSEKQQEVAAHELFFFTANGILDLFSDLVIR
jgi:hypothetical protein